jgi:hypothetical protein
VELYYNRLQTCRSVAPLRGIQLFPKGKEVICAEWRHRQDLILKAIRDFEFKLRIWHLNISLLLNRKILNTPVTNLFVRVI